MWLDDKSPINVPLADLTTIAAEQIDAVLAAAERILLDAGATVKGEARPAASTPRQPSDRHAPPSADAVVDLLDRMGHPVCFDRDAWTSATLSVRGCIVDLEAAGRLDEGDEERIADAACEWSARWDGGETDFDAEREKWDRDWSKRTPRGGWDTLQKHAERLIPGYTADFRPDGSEFGTGISAEEAAAEPRPIHHR